MDENFTSKPSEEPHRYFRNLCIELKKKINSSKDTELLKEEMIRFIDASRQMTWPHDASGKYHKDEGVKATDRLVKEFERYVRALETNSSAANSMYLLDALADIETLLVKFKVH